MLPLAALFAVNTLPLPRADAPRLPPEAARGGDSQPAPLPAGQAAPGADPGQAERTASQLGLAPGQVSVGVPGGASRAIVRFYSAADHALARSIGKKLAKMGYSWRIENLSGRPQPPGTQPLTVLLPDH